MASQLQTATIYVVGKFKGTTFVKVLPDFDGTYLTVFDRLWTIYSSHETDR
ncbi:MAG: hypothetical protein IPJ13_07405 [Saprospiraceae bacterium]|nr:hypothetical protein [Saprospiraceae bacterium]